MNKYRKLLLGAAIIPACLFARESTDSIADAWDKELELNEVVVVARRPVIKQEPDKIVYMIRNDPYANGLNGIEVLDRIPRVSVANEQVTVAGKSSVRYIVDGHILDIPEDAVISRLRNITAAGIEKIEVLTTPPAKYTAEPNVAFISITTRNESLGTKGNAWVRTNIAEFMSYSLGGNISHTARHIEFSADAGWNDAKGINDFAKQYTFPDLTRTSDRSSRFKWRTLTANGLLRYKFAPNFCMGIIANYSMMPIKTTTKDVTEDENVQIVSNNLSPAKPDNAITLSGFADWDIDSKGKILSLTYNFYNRHTISFFDITSDYSNGDKSRLTKDGDNTYRIHSLKFDAMLPFSMFKMECGTAYTRIGNKTFLDVANFIDNFWVNDPAQSNSFNYSENTFSLYLGAEKNLSSSFFAKIAARYEHTEVSGVQRVDNRRNNTSYDYLFPTLNLSVATRLGRFSADYSMGLERPLFGDLNPFRYYTTVKDYFTGNPDLKASPVHNIGINYSYRGVYAVLYCSIVRDAIGYPTRFEEDGTQWSMPENCMNTTKAGLYASYYRTLFDRWNVKLGGEVFYAYAKSKIPDFKQQDDKGWSGKIEVNTSWMLNRRKTLVLNMRFTHYLPYHDHMIYYESRSLLGCDIRYMLFDKRLTLTASVNDPFGWNITKSKALFTDFTVNTHYNIHSHSVSFRIAYSFGGNKVNTVYRDTKERESIRSN